MNSKIARVLVVGSSNTDLVLSCARLPGPGETLMGGDFRQMAGGKGANQAVAAARAGGEVAFVGAHGDDDFGKAAAADLRKEKIDTRFFLKKKGLSSGVALILVGGVARENMIAVARSANDRLLAGDIVAATRKIQHSDVVLAQLEVPLATVQKAAKLATQSHIPFLLNPAPARPLPASLLKQVHTLLPNEHEAFVLTGKKNPVEAGKHLLKLGCRNVVVTLGARGALLVNEEGHRIFPAPKVKPVDTVGAGDCFNGWFAVGLGEGMSLEEAIQRALAAASLSVTREGAQTSMPYRREVLFPKKRRKDG